MEIKKIDIANYKNLKDFSLALDGKSVVLYGKNGVGKSSTKQFCEMCLGYKSGTDPHLHINGEIIVGKDGVDYKIKINKDPGSPIKRTITSTTGVKQSSISWLKSFTGAINFNPEEFVKSCETEAGRKDSINMLKSFLSIEEQQDILILEKQISDLMNSRKEKNRVIDQLKGYIEQSHFEKVVEEPENTSDLLNQLNEIRKNNEILLDAKSKLNLHSIREEQLQNEILKLQEELSVVQTKKDNAEKYISSNRLQDTQIIEEKIRDQDNKQKDYHDYIEFCKKQQELQDLIESSTKDTQDLDKMRENRIQKIKGKRIILEGLDIKEDGFYYNNVYVDNKSLSTSELMMLSWQLKFEENPNMPLFIERGESLDQDKRDALFKLSQDNKVQVILEEVRRDCDDKIHAEFFEGN